MIIAITTSSFAEYSDQPLKMLEQAGLNFRLNPHGRKLTEAETTAFLDGCSGVIAGTEPITAAVINALPGLKVISRCGVGMDNVDIEAAEKRNIKVVNTPYGPTLAVAELTVGLILDLLRIVPWMDKELKRGVWKKRMGNLLFGKKVGIIGFGRIGEKVGELLTVFKTELAYCDLEARPCAFIRERKELNEILRWSDILTLHLSPSTASCPVIGIKELQLMQKGGWLVNVSRGGVVDEEALYEALKAGHLSGAAIDVFEKEPYNGPLRELDNVILTPHIGSYAKESRIKMEIDAVTNLIEALGL